MGTNFSGQNHAEDTINVSQVMTPTNPLKSQALVTNEMQRCNSVCRYEAVHHAVPVICIPFYLDQFAQCRNLVNRLKMGVLLYPKDLTKETFTKAVHQVLGNPEYKANAVKAQSILRDQPVKPRDLFLYWVNYTIRHQGAKHLVATAPFELNIFQYLSLDVVAFLTLPPLLTFVVCLKCLCWLCCGKKATDGNSEKKTQ